MGSRTLSLITRGHAVGVRANAEEDDDEGAERENLKIGVKMKNAVGGRRAPENRDGNDATITNGSGGGDDDDDEATTISNTVHLTDHFLTDRSRSGKRRE